MEKLEARLDKEVNSYLNKVETMEEVNALLSGNISKEIYKKFLKSFYIIEFLSQKAVKKASINTKEQNPYLSKRFDFCAQGEEGHAEIALNDLKEMGEENLDISGLQLIEEYDNFLQEAAENFPLGVLGHSYLFENVSGLLFTKNKPLNYPSKFIDVHAKEDPGHSIAIKRTVRNIEEHLEEIEIDKIIEFSRKSGEYLMKVFEKA